MTGALSLTGCQPGTEPESEDAVSSRLTSSTSQREGAESAAQDENLGQSESTSSTGTGASAPAGETKPADNPEQGGGSSSPSSTAESAAPQTGDHAEAEPPAQTAGSLKLTAEGVPVEVRLASDGNYRYEYDQAEYGVATAENGSTLEITVTDLRPETDNGDNVVIYIPNQSYSLVTAVLRGSSVTLPPINGNLTVESNAGSLVASLPSGYSQMFQYTGNASSCSLSMGGVRDFAVSGKISTSAVSVPSGWPVYDMLSPSYSYTSGTGAAKINLDVTSSSFIFQ